MSHPRSDSSPVFSMELDPGMYPGGGCGLDYFREPDSRRQPAKRCRATGSSGLSALYCGGKRLTTSNCESAVRNPGVERFRHALLQSRFQRPGGAATL